MRQALRQATCGRSCEASVELTCPEQAATHSTRPEELRLDGIQVSGGIAQLVERLVRNDVAQFFPTLSNLISRALAKVNRAFASKVSNSHLIPNVPILGASVYKGVYKQLRDEVSEGLRFPSNPS